MRFGVSCALQGLKSSKDTPVPIIVSLFVDQVVVNSQMALNGTYSQAAATPVHKSMHAKPKYQNACKNLQKLENVCKNLPNMKKPAKHENTCKKPALA
jgi:hypothetical protein